MWPNSGEACVRRRKQRIARWPELSSRRGALPRRGAANRRTMVFRGIQLRRAWLRRSTRPICGPNSGEACVRRRKQRIARWPEVSGRRGALLRRGSANRRTTVCHGIQLRRAHLRRSTRPDMWPNFGEACVHRRKHLDCLVAGLSPPTYFWQIILTPRIN